MTASDFIIKVLKDEDLTEQLFEAAFRASNFHSSDQAMFIMGFWLGRIYGEKYPFEEQENHGT